MITILIIIGIFWVVLNVKTQNYFVIFYYTDVYLRLCTDRMSQKWRTNYLLLYRGCLNVHEKNMEKMFPTKKSIIFIIIMNDNTM
jgi:hypothetical protein